MKTEEVLTRAVGKDTKRVAHDCNIAQVRLYKWMDGSNTNCLDNTSALIKHSKNGDEIIKYLCDKAGGYFVKALEMKGPHDFQIIPKTLKEFGELMQAMSDALMDGKVSEAELDRMKSEMNDVNALMSSFFNAVENGEYD